MILIAFTLLYIISTLELPEWLAVCVIIGWFYHYIHYISTN